MENEARLKSLYDAIVVETESLKSKRVVILQKSNHVKLSAELRKSKLDSLRKKLDSLQMEYLDCQNEVSEMKSKNESIKDELSLVEEVRNRLNDEIDENESYPDFDYRVNLLIENEKDAINELRLKLAEMDFIYDSVSPDPKA